MYPAGWLRELPRQAGRLLPPRRRRAARRRSRSSSSGMVDDNETGKADARLASNQAVALNLTREAARRRRAHRGARRRRPAGRRGAADRDARGAAGPPARAALEHRRGCGSPSSRRRATVADTGGADAVFPAAASSSTATAARRARSQVSVADAAGVRPPRRGAHRPRGRRLLARPRSWPRRCAASPPGTLPAAPRHRRRAGRATTAARASRRTGSPRRSRA